jgi:long-chain acyl-CoA synthetase
MIAAERVTVFEGVPTMYVGMLGAAERNDVDVSSLRVCVSGGAAMPVEVLRAFENRFGCTVLEGYGLSETSPAVCFKRPNRVRKVGSIGTPIDGVEMRIVDDNGNNLPVASPGEIQVRGHNVMKGYWNLPDATDAATRMAGSAPVTSVASTKMASTTSSTARKISSSAEGTTYTRARWRRRCTSIPPSLPRW